MITEKLAELYATAPRIILLSPNELHGPFGALSRYVPQHAANLTHCPKASEAEVQASREKLAELATVFMMTARNDLGVHPPGQLWNEPPKRVWWRFWDKGPRKKIFPRL
jgi:hypothetical protein